MREEACRLAGPARAHASLLFSMGFWGALNCADALDDSCGDLQY
jgi:hypothetical protein